ncbi:MAG: tRNA-(ms[2]io[6]A)-hydroxylase [Pseudomonadota bacterium]
MNANANRHSLADATHGTPHEPLSIALGVATTPAWVETVLAEFDTFLIDHAACERKAAAVATSMICHYPDRAQLVADMADLAAEEMSHFRQVIKLIHARGIQLTPDTKDPYVNALRKHVRHGKQEYLLDRLLIAGLVEARGTERFALIGEHCEESTLRQFYHQLAVSEARHQRLFVDLALRYVPDQIVAERLRDLQSIEAEIVTSLPLRAALH